VSLKLEVGRAAEGCQSSIKGCISGAFPDGQWQFSQVRGVRVLFVDELWYVRPLVFIGSLSYLTISSIVLQNRNAGNVRNNPLSSLIMFLSDRDGSVVECQLFSFLILNRQTDIFGSLQCY
jgi:hypothetical protein